MTVDHRVVVDADISADSHCPAAGDVAMLIEADVVAQRQPALLLNGQRCVIPHPDSAAQMQAGRRGDANANPIPCPEALPAQRVPTTLHLPGTSGSQHPRIQPPYRPGYPSQSPMRRDLLSTLA